jgi:hypothetical protein
MQQRTRTSLILTKIYTILILNIPKPCLLSKLDKYEDQF